MDADDFIKRYPVLWHLADAAAWPSIKRNGLLCTAEIVRRWELTDAAAQALLSRRRPDQVRLDHPQNGHAVLRDQRPLSEERLAPALTDGMTVEGWLRLLNSFVFFFPTETGLRALYAAYDSQPVVVLQVSTRSLMQEHGARVRLAGINTGYTKRRPALRGADTFLPIRRYDHARRKVQEVAVLDGVTDVTAHLTLAQNWLPGGVVEPLSL